MIISHIFYRPFRVSFWNQKSSTCSSHSLSPFKRLQSTSFQNVSAHARPLSFFFFSIDKCQAWADTIRKEVLCRCLNSDLCFAICRFAQEVLITPSVTSRTISFFISNSFCINVFYLPEWSRQSNKTFSRKKKLIMLSFSLFDYFVAILNTTHLPTFHTTYIVVVYTNQFSSPSCVPECGCK